MKYPLFLFITMMLAAWGMHSCVMVANSREGPPTLGVVVWDFSKNRDLAVVDWPQEVTQDFFFSCEIKDLTVIFPDGITERFRNVKPVVNRNGNRVDSMGVYFQEKSIERAVSFADFWCKRWDVTKMRVSLDEFQRQVLKDPNYPRVVRGDWRASNNRILVEIIAASPWAIELTFPIRN